MPELPAIDLGRLSDASDGADETAKLRSALQSWGLFVVSNHGVETSLMEDVITASREFFRQPVEEKKKHTMIDGKHLKVEGYGNDLVKTDDQVLDWCDRLHLKVEPVNERNIAFWPTYPKSFRDTLHEYTLQTKRIKDCILRAVAKILELDEDCLINKLGDKALAHARFNYYPRCPRPDLVLGIKPHYDLGVLTVLLMDKNVGGLQVRRDGTWYSLPNFPDYTLVINLGVTMEIMTNGIFKGAEHRVVTNSERERLSVAAFYTFDPEEEIEPLADLNQLPRYMKIKGRDLSVKYYEHFFRGVGVVDSIKI